MIARDVCHYTKAKTLLKILDTKKLRISRFKFTNDPRESKDRNAAIVWLTNESHSSYGDQTTGQIKKGRSSLLSNSDQEGKTATQISRIANEIALEEWKVLCVTLNRPQRTVRHIQDEVYNHSISPGYSRPRMWAQYAENHSGACIIFDASKLNTIIHRTLESRCRIFQGRVAYNYKSLVFNTISMKYLQANIEMEKLTEELRRHYIINYKETFLVKHPDWRDEAEYRWILYTRRKSNLYIPIENSIKAILVGIDFPKHYEPRLIEYCKELKISVGKVEWDDGIALSKFGSIYKP